MKTNHALETAKDNCAFQHFQLPFAMLKDEQKGRLVDVIALQYAIAELETMHSKNLKAFDHA